MPPDLPTFGPRLRYVGLSDADLQVRYQALLRVGHELLGMAARLDRVDVGDVVQGLLQLAIRRAFDDVSRDLRALSCEAVTRIDQLNRAIGR